MTRTGRHMLIATLATAGVGVYRAGLPGQVPGGADASWLAALAAGAAAWLPALVVVVIASRLWAELFARLRRRPLDPDWLPIAWLFALMLPAETPYAIAAVSLSFGLVFGCHVFGGSGRYLVHPALVAIVFLRIGYPAQAGAGDWLPLGDVDRITEIYALSCLLGAAYLVAVRVASMALVVAGLAGLAVAAIVAGEPPWSAELALGQFAFALAFIATDPTPAPRSLAARIAFGLLFGLLTFALRTLNPDRPEGSFEALLLASLCIPMLDRIAASLPFARREVSDA